MSLFGESPTEEAPIQSQSRNSLFDEPAKGASSSLFDDGNEWTLPAAKASKKQARNGPEVVRTLLRDAHIPDEYIDLFDDIKREEGSVNVSHLGRLMTSVDISGSSQTKILELLAKTSGDKTAVTRDEFNVFMALVGLQLEGEEVSLDAVDERRRNLPVPDLSYSDLPSSPSSSTPAPDTTTDTSSQAIQPASTAIDQTMPQIMPSLPQSNNVDQNDDPWGSPELHAGHNHNQKTNAAKYTIPSESQRPDITSNSGMSRPSYSSIPTGLSDTDDLQASLRGGRRPSMNAWGGGQAGSFADVNPDAGHDSIGTSRMGRYSSTLGGRGALNVEERITITSLAEKEGMFMFRHRNYQISSDRRGSRVVRRYSDFVWLLDCLLKRYPFRQLPILPPKRLAADNAFIERRRRGLSRFLNALVRHPILKDETLVVMFLTVPTELSVWRKQATISVQEEFVDRPLPPGLEDSLPANLNETFDTVRAGVKRSCDTYIALCTMLERFGKRNEGLAADYRRIATSFTSLTEMSSATYGIDTTEVALMNDGFNSVAKHYNEAEAIMDDEIRALDVGVIEDFKRQRDTLVAVRDLFDRRDKYAVDNISTLEKNIRNNEDKLRNARAKPAEQIKPGEIEKLENSITTDKASIVRQHNRSVLIRECIRDELLYFQTSQYHISRMHQDWAQDRIKYAELQAENWKALSQAMEGMPLGE